MLQQHCVDVVVTALLLLCKRLRRLLHVCSGWHARCSSLAARAAGEDAICAHRLVLPRPTRSYLLYACACFVERTWRFGLPLVLAFVEGGFQVKC